MKLRYLVIFVIVAMGAWGWQRALPVRVAVEDKWRELTTVRQFEIQGLRALTVSDLEKRFPPRETTYLDWLVRSHTHEQRLAADPWIREAVVSRCKEQWWGCIAIAIEEERPSFVAIIGGVAWLASADGNFLGHVAEDSLQTHISSIEKDPVDGLPIEVRFALSEQPSPDAIRGSLRSVRDATATVEGATGLQVSSVEVRTGGEFAVRFREHPFSVVFDGFEGPQPRLGEELKRLNSILAAAGNGVSSIEQIDLAFERVAVIDKVDKSAPQARAQPRQ